MEEKYEKLKKEIRQYPHPKKLSDFQVIFLKIRELENLYHFISNNNSKNIYE